MLPSQSRNPAVMKAAIEQYLNADNDGYDLFEITDLIEDDDES